MVATALSHLARLELHAAPIDAWPVVAQHARTIHDDLAAASLANAHGFTGATLALRRDALDAARRLVYFHARRDRLEAWRMASEFNRRKRFAGNALNVPDDRTADGTRGLCLAEIAAAQTKEHGGANGRPATLTAWQQIAMTAAAGALVAELWLAEPIGLPSPEILAAAEAWRAEVS